MSNCAIYARVSTKKIGKNGKTQDPAYQLSEMREYCKRQGWEVYREFVDRMSGKKANRPALDELMEAAKLRKFDVVLVWKIDRFGRSVRHLVNSVEQLRNWGVRFISMTQPIDTGDPVTANLIFNIFAAVAEFESAMTAERVSAAAQYLISKGKKWGRREIEIDLNRARSLVASHGLRSAAAEIGVSHETLRQRLQAAKSATA
jgi:DNA invertase Pin-like site-specific DNA recombinase